LRYFGLTQNIDQFPLNVRAIIPATRQFEKKKIVKNEQKSDFLKNPQNSTQRSATSFGDTGVALKVPNSSIFCTLSEKLTLVNI
jgi:hypothetical protein